MRKNYFNKVKKVHFIGIGGIGISAIARMFLAENKSVAGSDSYDSELIQELKDHGARINIGHNAENVEADVDLVIYTIAVREDNPELLTANKLGIPIMSYPQALHEISKNKYTIAIFQPHLFSRTKLLLEEFAKCFDFADEVILLPIYPAREQFDPSTSSEILSEKIKLNGKRAQVIRSADEIRNYLLKNSSADSLILTIGAGDVYKLTDQLITNN